ncbi:MAG: hypothetical protein MMC23_009379 [Stictis urceolatum]|nr:hypothetical protein [Stictis urceolata]
MAPSDDIRAHATSSFDFYGLLTVSSDFTQRELDRARRFTSFKYHPDKVGDDAAAREKLHMTNIGYEILSDPQLRSLYDNARNARERKRASEAHLEAGRRKLKEDLEARELAGLGNSGFAAEAGANLDEYEQQLCGLAGDGKQRRQWLQARREREQQQEAGRRQVQQRTATSSRTYAIRELDEDVPELDRSIKISLASANSPPPAPTRVAALFEHFGRIDSTFFVSNRHKSSKLKKEQQGHIVHTAYVVFIDQSSAAAAIRYWESQMLETADPSGLWTVIESVTWAGGEEPEGLDNTANKPASHTSPLEDAQGQSPSADSCGNPFAQLNLEAQALRVLEEAAARQTLISA